MKVLQPVEITGAKLVSSTAAEPNLDAAAEIESTWDASVSYPIGARANFGHRKYESVKGSNPLYVRAVRVLRSSAIQPTTPSGGTYTFTGNVFSPPAGWVRDDYIGPLASPVWASTYVFVTTTPDIPLAGPASGDATFSAAALILNCGGSNGSTTFTDSSSYAHTATRSGTPTISTAQTIDGNPMVAFNGSTDWLSYADSNDWDLAASNFCIEAFIYLSALPASFAGIVSKTRTGVNYGEYSFGVTSAGVLQFACTTGGEQSANWNYILASAAGTITAATKFHVAVTRSGTTFKLFVNGVTVATSTSSITVTNATGRLAIGANKDDGSFKLSGYIGPVRIKIGAAQYTTDFAVPSAPFPLAGTGSGGWPTPISYSQPSANTVTLAVYRTADSSYSAPSGGTYAPFSGLLTPPTGWSATPPAPGLYGVLACTITITYTGVADVALGQWGTPYAYASAGLNTMALSAPLLTLQADATGFVPNLTQAISIISVVSGGVPETSSWTLSINVPTGVTATLSVDQISVTSMTVDNATIYVTGTRTGYPTQTRALALVRNKSSATLSAALSGQRFSATTSLSSAATASVRFNSDGTVTVRQGNSASYLAGGSWFTPTGTPGGSYWIKAVPRVGYTGATSGTSGAWVSLASAQTFSETTTGSGQNLASLLDYQISSSSSGSPVVASGLIDLRAVYP